MAEQKTAEAEELMSAYLDEQLAPEEAARVEKLLAESPEAREELSGLQSMLKLVKGLPEVEAPPDFYQKVAKETKAQNGRSKPGAAPTTPGTSPDANNLPHVPNLPDPRPI